MLYNIACVFRYKLNKIRHWDWGSAMLKKKPDMSTKNRPSGLCELYVSASIIVRFSKQNSTNVNFLKIKLVKLSRKKSAEPSGH